MRTPLVSILIPAYNAEKLIAFTLQSAVGQTWENKEIIVVDDGSRDRTADVARQFASKSVKVVSTQNQGLSATVNNAFKLCQGDYIQELDSDDLLAPDKIERQLKALREGDSKRILLASPMAHFHFRPRRARFIPNILWQDDLSPAEWLIRKMSQKLHMQNATWLVSREIATAAGPWSEDLHYDQDGEYFCRVLLASEKTRFVREARVYYRRTGSSQLSRIGNSDKKKDSLLRSIKVHIDCLTSLEKSERVRLACLAYLQSKYIDFHPERPDLIAELQNLANKFQGKLEPLGFDSKYALVERMLGWNAAKAAQGKWLDIKDSAFRTWDKMIFKLEDPKKALSMHSRQIY
jgi:glycosyltransferase involved in cell wall biosynthesis